MANDISAILPVAMAQFLMPLREACFGPQLCNRMFDNVPASLGDVVNVVISSAMTVGDVSPSFADQAGDDVKPIKVPVTLDRWKRAGFVVADKELDLLGEGGMAQQIAEAAKAMANYINADIWSQYYRIYGCYGTPGTTPFAGGTSLADGAQVRKVLNKQLAPLVGRKIVLDPEAEANVIILLANANLRGDSETMRTGRIGQTLGMDWYMDQQIPIHTAGVLNAGAITVNGAQAVGAGSLDNGRTGTLSIAKAAGVNGTLNKGDIITIAGDSQTYAVQATTTIVQAGNTTVPIRPSLRKATVGAEAITQKASHTVNLAFHELAFVFASRPLSSRANRDNQYTVVDDVSGLAFRVELKRQNKQDILEWDVLYGVGVYREEFAARLFG